MTFNMAGDRCWIESPTALDAYSNLQLGIDGYTQSSEIMGLVVYDRTTAGDNIVFFNVDKHGF